MPIHYVALLNRREDVVLQGIYKSGGSNFKTSVTKFTSQIRQHGTKMISLDDKLILVYRNHEAVTAAIVITKEIDL